MQFKKDEVKEKIINAATEEFEINGYRGALINNIAKASGIPVGNIYRYFSSKSALFDAVVEDAYQNMPEIIFKAYEKDKILNRNVKEIAKNIAGSIMHIYKKYSKQLLILTDKSEGTKYKNFIYQIISQIAKLIEKELFKNSDKYDGIISDIITKGFVNGLFDILRKTENGNIQQMTERLLLFYFYRIEERI